MRVDKGTVLLCYAEHGNFAERISMAALQPDPCALLPFSAGQLTPMQAIEARHAVRSYTDEPLAPEAVEALREAIAQGERGSEPEHSACA